MKETESREEERDRFGRKREKEIESLWLDKETALASDHTEREGGEMKVGFPVWSFNSRAKGPKRRIDREREGGT